MRAVGDHAVLLELPGNAAVHAAARLARQRFGDQLVDVVPGHVTLLLAWRDGSVGPSESELAELTAATEDRSPGRLTTVPVSYDGADLHTVAARLGLSPEAVVRLHSEALYTVAFTGFAPGFPYLIGLPPELELPRLETPRARVPAGSVAVAARYCGIYPRASPGGWHLLGHTEVELFDPRHEPPALLTPGMRVRFDPARE